MSIPFPNIQPSSRRFVAPRWPVTSSKSQSAVVSKRLWGSKPGDGQLSLSFNNIRDDIAGQIVEAYNLAKGSTVEVKLPDSIFEGTKDSLSTYLKATLKQQGIKWFFKDDEPPDIESVVPGISNVRVNLSGELRLESA